MPDNLSPEEKLLRLIKGEKTDSPPQPAPRETVKKPEPPAKEPQKDTAPPPLIKPETAKKPVALPDSSVSKPAPPNPQLDTAPEKKTASPPTPPVTEPPKPAAVTPSKPVPPQPKKPANTTSTASVPPDPALSPAAIPDETPAFTAPRSMWIVYAMRWLISGFNFFNILLLFILIIVILLTFWYLPAQQPAAQTAAAIVPGSDNDGTTEEFIAPLPRPFPYYVTAFAQKSLFKVIKPPPPPKPKVERKEKEKPKILIETLTRHLVLQGIVYDIGPPQAIVFDKKANKTMFLGNGDMITDQVKIKEIHRGKVILEFEEQTQELSF